MRILPRCLAAVALVTLWLGDVCAQGAPDLSECYGPYRIRPYLKVAAALQAMPEVDRAAQLRTWAQAKKPGEWYGPLDDQVIRLCRILFERKPGGVFRASFQGMPMFAAEDRVRDWTRTTDEIERLWPDSPFVFMDDVPFDAASRGHMLAGARESAERYLAYCLEAARWTSRDYAKVLQMDLGAVLIRLFSDYPWPGELSQYDREFLAEQIKPYEVPGLSNAIHPSGKAWEGQGGFAAMGIGTKGLRLERVEQVSLTVQGGVRPYRYKITYSGEVVREGIGEAEPANPFEPQRFPMPWPLAGVGWLRCEITDAAGTILVQRLEVIDAATLKAYCPSVTMPAAQPAPDKKL